MRYYITPFPKSVMIFQPMLNGAAAAGFAFLGGSGLGYALGMPRPEAVGAALAGVTGSMVTTYLASRWQEKAAAAVAQLGEDLFVGEDQIVRKPKVQQWSPIPEGFPQEFQTYHTRVESLITYDVYNNGHEIERFYLPASNQQLDLIAAALARRQYSLAYNKWVGRGNAFEDQPSFRALREALAENELAVVFGPETRQEIRWNDHGKKVFMQRAQKRGLVDPPPAGDLTQEPGRGLYTQPISG